MGIPGFFSWLTKQYPKIKTVFQEDERNTDNRSFHYPVGPDGIRENFHNLYIDMNGIIHKCTHFEESPPLDNDDVIIKSVFDYIDRIFSIVRPVRLIYMALDGVAPRARMTLQRSARFLESKNIPDQAKSKFLTEDQIPTEEIKYIEKCQIKPGTEFMSRLSDRLQYYIRHRMNTDQAWRQLKVILSDANVPGEGEHKIINFIRRQRLQPGHDPNTHHIVFSSDSDLILLGLATHEPYFTIISEDNQNKESSRTNYMFIHLSILREYLYYELEIDNSSSFKRNLERAIDDWVFLCLLLGNDFLPNSPSIDSPKYAMGRLIRIYKSTVGQFGEYLTENGIANMRCVAIVLRRFGEEEDEIFMKRHEAARRQGTNDFDMNDTIRLWEEGSRQRYYKDKFDASEDELEEVCTKVTKHYARGLCWVLRYYYQGEPSWDWYYPYHYAPFASDFANLRDVSGDFNRNTQPFSPLEQMMATFSPQNAKYLPLQCQSLIRGEALAIIDYYPRNFIVDPNDKYYASKYVALLPFVDEKRLLKALKRVDLTLTFDEESRNKRDYDRVFIHSTNPWYKQFKILYNGNSGNQITQTNPLSISTELSKGIGGKIWPDDKEKNIRIGKKLKAPIANWDNIPNNQVIYVMYRDFQFPDGYIFKAKLLDFVEMPRKILDHNDYRRTHNRSHIDSAQQSQREPTFVRNQDSNCPWRSSSRSYHN